MERARLPRTGVSVISVEERVGVLIVLERQWVVEELATRQKQGSLSLRVSMMAACEKVTDYGEMVGKEQLTVVGKPDSFITHAKSTAAARARSPLRFASSLVSSRAGPCELRCTCPERLSRAGNYCRRTHVYTGAAFGASTMDLGWATPENNRNASK